MATSSTVVIKVKYGDMLRRFSAQIADDKLLLNMDGLREKILALFSFAPATELMLTYLDEDGDVVALVDEDDLRDVVKQDLDPVRITVKVNDGKSAGQYTDSSASSTPSKSPSPRHPLLDLAGISYILSNVPEPKRDNLVKLMGDFASTASSSVPVISELVDLFSKVSSSYLAKPTGSHSGVDSGTSADVPGSSTSATESKNPESTIKLEPEVSKERNEVKSQTVAEQSKKTSYFDFNAVAAALGSQNENVPKFGPVTCEKEKLKKYAESFMDNNVAGKEVCNPFESKLGTNSGSGGDSDPAVGDLVNDKTTSSVNSSFPTWAPPFGASPFGGLIELYNRPHSGTGMGSTSAVPPYPGCEPVPSRGNDSKNDGIGIFFHRGIRCDGCGIHPILGPRFKSKVKVDYDLCRICFEEIGNTYDYIRIDRPAVSQPLYWQGLHNAVCPRPYVGHNSRVLAKLDNRFIRDVNIFDGTVMAPLTQFTKIWRMRNNGTLAWPPKTQLIWIEGDKLSNELSVEVQIPPGGLLTDEELDIAVDFISPELPGQYISYWRMASSSGQKFGQRVWVLIQVDASLAETTRTVRNLNLNLPPVSCSLPVPEMINVKPEPMVVSCPVFDNSKKAIETGKPDDIHEWKFPNDNSMFFSNGAYTSLPSSSTSSSVSYPGVDFPDVAPPLPSVSLAILHPIKPLPMPSAPIGSGERSGDELPGKNKIEEELLRDLEEMGFNQIDLNKQVLRMNEYDLEQALDDLCGVAKWDPILEELQEMGFNDREMNKKLLVKNNGSIKHVVLDLIAGEKI